MAKTMCWIGWVKRFFTSDPKAKSEKKSKKWRWVTERFKAKQCPTIAAAPPQKTLCEATEERRRQALSVAVATAAAAEAAVAAANAAAEVVRLTAASGFHFSKRDRISAAIKIQSFFRGHIARKALKALKGIVRLQAIVRGRAVRRQRDASLKRPRIERRRNSKVSQKKTLVAERSCNSCGKKLQPKEENELKACLLCQLDLNSVRNWDGTTRSTKGMEALNMRKQEALIKRERMLKYSFSHREGRSVQIAEECGGRSGEVDKRDMEREEAPRQTVSINLITDETYGKRVGNVKLSSHCSLPRRSFCHVKNSSSSGGDDQSCMPSSPVFPTYMAITESARAKARSISTPKQRIPSFLNDLSFWSSFDGDLIRDIS